jgi:type I restriction enzyme M protein
MADERTKAPCNQKSPVPEKYSWPSLIKKDGDELFDHYCHTLEVLGNQKGFLGLIFNKPQNNYQRETRPKGRHSALVALAVRGTA